MEKPFDNWSLLKKKLNEKNPKTLYFKEREIWYCSIGINVGHEQDGKNEYFERPVIIIKKFNAQSFLGIPLTSKKLVGEKYFYWKFVNNKESTALFEHMKSLDIRRLQRKISQVPQKIFNRISHKMRRLLK